MFEGIVPTKQVNCRVLNIMYVMSSLCCLRMWNIYSCWGLGTTATSSTPVEGQLDTDEYNIIYVKGLIKTKHISVRKGKLGEVPAMVFYIPIVHTMADSKTIIGNTDSATLVIKNFQKMENTYAR